MAKETTEKKLYDLLTTRDYDNFQALDSRTGKVPVDPETGAQDVSRADMFTFDWSSSRGKNYGVFAQLGMGNNPRRPFVEMTPKFVKMANEILRFYVLYGTAEEIKKEQIKVPSNSWLMQSTKEDLRKFEKRMERKKAGMMPFGASHIIQQEGVKPYKRQTTTVGGKSLGKRGS